MRKFLAVLPAIALLATTACTDGNPIAPSIEEKAAPAAAIDGVGPSLSSTTSAGLSQEFTSDLNFIDGLVPSFTDASTGARFGELVKELRTHLNTGDKAEASRVLDLAEKELATGALNAGDTGYVEFVFRELGEMLAQ